MKDQIQQSVEEFDERFGKLKNGCECGDDSSMGNRAGCDDCEINQRTRESHRQFIIKSLKANTQAVIEMLEGMRTDERRVATFGEWQAETYEDKMLVNAVIQEAIDKLKAEITE